MVNRYFGTEVYVVRRVPGHLNREWRVTMISHGGQALIKSGVDVQAGDEVYQHALLGLGRRELIGVVAYVDWDSRSQLKQGVIIWAGPSRTRSIEEETGVALDLDLHGMLLLDWLYEQSGDNPRFFDVNEFTVAKGLQEGSGRFLVQHLSIRSLVKPILASGGFVQAMITTEGIGHIQSIRAKRADLALRTRSLRQQLLVWLHAQEHQETPPPDWSDFTASPNAHFYGIPFKPAELETAVNDLVSRNLVTSSVSAWGAGKGMLKPQLTADGRDCVIDYEGNVTDYLNRRQAGATNNTTNITMTDSNGNITLASENVMQSIETGFDPRRVLDFAALVKESLPVISLPEDQKPEVTAQAQELHEEASSSTPDKGKLRSLVDSIKAALITAAPAIITKTAIELGNEALRAING